MAMASQSRSPSKSVVAWYRPLLTAAATRSAPMCLMNDSPLPRSSTLRGSTSNPDTGNPASWKSRASGSPTYPCPTMPMRALRSWIRARRALSMAADSRLSELHLEAQSSRRLEELVGGGDLLLHAEPRLAALGDDRPQADRAGPAVAPEQRAQLAHGLRLEPPGVDAQRDLGGLLVAHVGEQLDVGGDDLGGGVLLVALVHPHLPVHQERLVALHEHLPVAPAPLRRPVALRGPPAPADDLHRPRQVLEREEAEAGALLLVLPLAQVADHAHHRDLVPLPLRLHLGAVGRGVAPGLLLVAGQRVPADVEAQRLLLGGQPHPLRPLGHLDLAHPVARLGVARHGLGGGKGAEEARLAALPVGVGRGPGREGRVDPGGEPPARHPLEVEGPALHQGLDDLLVHPAWIDAAAEVEEAPERAALLAGGQYRLHRAVAHALHGAEPEADAPLARGVAGRMGGEGGRRLVHAGGKNLDARLAGPEDVGHHLVGAGGLAGE